MPAATFQDLFAEAHQRPPRIAIVLGSGLGELAGRVTSHVSVPFLKIPGFQEPTTAGHEGCLRLGTWENQSVLVFAGRLHYYEGHPWRRVMQAVHVCLEMGVETLVFTNAAGGIRDDLVPGSLMLLEDHLEWTLPCCWRTKGPGERPSPYDLGLRELLGQAARNAGNPLATGIYAQVTGPCYETRAEIRALKSLGADAVGMSTAREVQVASELGLRCAAISCITNCAAGLAPGIIHHGEVLANAHQARDRLGKILEGFLQLQDSTPRGGTVNEIKI